MPIEAPHHHRIRVDIDGTSIGHFKEVSIGAATTNVDEFREGTDRIHIRKIPGMTKYANVTLKRGITSELNLYQWHRQIVEAQPGSFQRTVSITLTNRRDQTVAKFNLRDAWPIRYEAAPLFGEGNEIAIETIELTHEGFEREL